MKIAESYVAMSSSRNYAKTETKETTAQIAPSRPTDIIDSDSYRSPKLASPSQLQNYLVRLLIQRMRENLFSLHKFGKANANPLPATSSQWKERNILRSTKEYHHELEETGFKTQGHAVTEDGRTIDFDIHVLMSRNCMEYIEQETKDISIDAISPHIGTVDPLVINVGAQCANISDQTFFFDLDGDGNRENVHMLGQGSGFLALDKNGDGIINNGNELFGPQSGDGFQDLRQYDQDQNGWIDENDAIFSQLKVWCKGEHGEDILMDLKSADVGAIYLGEQATNFTIKGSGNGTNGVVRSTGFYLKESGGAGTIQHVDLGVENPKSHQGNQPITYTRNQTSISSYQWICMKKAYHLH